MLRDSRRHIVIVEYVSVRAGVVSSSAKRENITRFTLTKNHSNRRFIKCENMNMFENMNSSVKFCRILMSQEK